MNTPLLEINMALLDSIKRGDLELTEALLGSGADPNQADLLDGQSALQHAAGQGPTFVQLLLTYGATPPLSPPGKVADAVVPPWLNSLRQLYQDLGYVRRPAQEDANSEETDHLWEVRFLVSGKRKVAQLRSLLEEAQLPCGEVKRLHGFQTLILAGRETVQRLLALLPATQG